MKYQGMCLAFVSLQSIEVEGQTSKLILDCVILSDRGKKMEVENAKIKSAIC